LTSGVSQGALPDTGWHCNRSLVVTREILLSKLQLGQSTCHLVMVWQFLLLCY